GNGQPQVGVRHHPAPAYRPTRRRGRSRGVSRFRQRKLYHQHDSAGGRRPAEFDERRQHALTQTDWHSHVALMRRRSKAVFLALILWPTPAVVSGASYDELKAAALKQCQAIDPGAYQSGLLFNPEGYRSFYVRSECLQKTAAEFRDESLCAQVKE